MTRSSRSASKMTRGVARADEEDVRADHRAEHQHRRLLEQVRRRQQADRPVLARRQDLGDCLERRKDRAVEEHHALGVAGRAARVDHLEQRLAGGPRPRVDLRLPVGREGDVVAALVGVGRRPRATGGAASHSTVRILRCSRPPSAGSGASSPVPMASHCAPALWAILWSTSGAMRRSSGTTTAPARIAPK